MVSCYTNGELKIVSCILSVNCSDQLSAVVRWNENDQLWH